MSQTATRVGEPISKARPGTEKVGDFHSTTHTCGMMHTIAQGRKNMLFVLCCAVLFREDGRSANRGRQPIGPFGEDIEQSSTHRARPIKLKTQLSNRGGLHTMMRRGGGG
jgi:hypothetical protein